MLCKSLQKINKLLLINDNRLEKFKNTIFYLEFMTKRNYLADVENLGQVVELCNDFYSCLQSLKRKKADLISPRDEAYAGIHTSEKEDIGKSCGTWTTFGFEYAKDSQPLLRRSSRLLDKKLAKLAVESNRNRKYFSTQTRQEYDDSLRQAEQDKRMSLSERQVLILPHREVFEASSDILEFSLQDLAGEYYKFNGNNPIKVYPVNKDVVDSQDGTILTQLWFSRLGGRSDFGGNGRDLYVGGRARGVRRVESAEGTEKKFLEEKRILQYTERQLNQYINIVEKVRQGSLPASRLEKVAEFLSGLKQ